MSSAGTTGISIHALLAESDREPTPTRWPQKISIHALLAESDAVSLSPQSRTYRFLSTLSLRRATSCFAWNCAKCRYFYPRSPCGERLGQGRDLFLVHFISIHALLAESDPTPRRTLPARSRFLSTLSLRRATDKDREKALNIALFLSTLSLRRATQLKTALYILLFLFLSTLSLRRATNYNSLQGSWF